MTGTTINATTDTPTSIRKTAAELSATKRFSPRRPTLTSPARPDAASIPVAAAAASVAAKTRSSTRGETPRSIESVITEKSVVVDSPTAMITATRSTFSSVIRSTKRSRSGEIPRTLKTITAASTSAMIAVSSPGSFALPQNALR